MMLSPLPPRYCLWSDTNSYILCARVPWDDDAEADVLYLLLGRTQAAVGVDIRAGVMVHYNEPREEVVGSRYSDCAHDFPRGFLPGACRLRA